jgi:protein TonB
VDLPETDVVFDIPEGPPPSPEPEGPIQVGGDVEAPVKIYYPQPQYTEIARKARLQGVVIVQAIIDKGGNVTNVKLLKGLGMGLDQAAIDAIKKWQFEPATLHGKPVSVYYNLTVNFRLQ